jgi:hypothetical protein
MRAITPLVATTFAVLPSDAFALARLLSVMTVMSGAALAQTTGTINPSTAPEEPSVLKEDVPPGGCMPIGLTASGEIVFPIQCTGIIERERGKAVERKPAVVAEKPAAKQSEAPAPESSKPAIKPVETVPAPKNADHKPRESRLPLAAGPSPARRGSDP